MTDHIAELRRQGMSLQAIGIRMNISAQAVKDRLNRLGVDTSRATLIDPHAVARRELTCAKCGKAFFMDLRPSDKPRKYCTPECRRGNGTTGRKPKVAREYRCRDCGLDFSSDEMYIDVVCVGCGSIHVIKGNAI